LDPLYTIHCNKNPGSTCPIEGMQVTIPAKALPASSEDAHMDVVDQGSGYEWSFYNVQTVPLPPLGGTITIGWGGRTRIDTGDGSGACADMGCFGLVGGAIREQELAAGHIDHALFLIVGCTNGSHVYPAQDTGVPCTSTTNAPAAGQ